MTDETSVMDPVIPGAPSVGDPTTPPPVKKPNVEFELAKLANDAIVAGNDPHDVTNKLHQSISYLRQYPKMAEHANNALADGVATPAEISRTLWPHIKGTTNAATLPGIDATDDEPTSLPEAAARSFLATQANLGRGFPPLAMAQNLARAVTSGAGDYSTPGSAAMSIVPDYMQAKNEIDQETDKIPSFARAVGRGLGAAPATMLLPGSTAGEALGSAIALGATEGMDDPSLSSGDLAKGMAKAIALNVGTVGAFHAGAQAIGAGRNIMAARALEKRVSAAPTLGHIQTGIDASTKTEGIKNYGDVAAEADVSAQRPTPKAVQDAFSNKVTKPFVDLVRGTERFGAASDGDVGREVLKQMSNTNQSILEKIRAKGEYDAKLALQSSDIKSAIRKLRAALSMPSENPPITFDVPASHVTTEPTIRADTPGPAKSTSFTVPAQKHGPFGVVEGVTKGQPGPTYDRATPTPAPPGSAELFPLPHQPGEGRSVSFKQPPVEGPGTTGKPGFVLKGETKPGIDMTTPAMRVQTAPAEAVPPMLPSLPKADQAHASALARQRIFQQAQDDALRLGRGTPIKANRQKTQSAEAVMNRINGPDEMTPGMTPDQAQDALSGFLGRGKDLMKPPKDVQLHPSTQAYHKLKSLVNPSPNLQRISPFIQALDARITPPAPQAGAPAFPSPPMDDFLKALSIAHAGTRP